MECDGVPVKSLFPLKKDLLHLNTGSFGVTPTEVIEHRNAIQAEIDAETDLWFRYTFVHRFDEAADLLADLYKAPREQVTIITNATHGVNTVLLSLDMKPGDEILVTDYTYGAIRMQCEDKLKRCGGKIRKMNVRFPFSHESIIKQYEEELPKMTGERKIAIVDHITSGGSLLMPVEQIIPLCKKFNVLSIVDGAHAPGQLTPSELNISKLQPDFYTGNLHKWAFVPRPCAFLYVSAPFLDVVRQPIISWLHEKPFRYRFSFKGTFETSGIACIPAAFRFAEKLGGTEAIQKFVRSLLREGMEYVCNKLETTLLCPEEYSAPLMMSFYLGQGFDDKIEIIKAMTAKTFETRLLFYMREHVKASSSAIGVMNGRCVMRVCAHVFTTMDDFHRLADGLLKMRRHIQTMTVDDVAALPTVDWKD